MRSALLVGIVAAVGLVTVASAQQTSLGNCLTSGKWKEGWLGFNIGKFACGSKGVKDCHFGSKKRGALDGQHFVRSLFEHFLIGSMIPNCGHYRSTLARMEIRRNCDCSLQAYQAVISIVTQMVMTTPLLANGINPIKKFSIIMQEYTPRSVEILGGLAKDSWWYGTDTPINHLIKKNNLPP